MYSTYAVSESTYWRDSEIGFLWGLPRNAIVGRMSSLVSSSVVPDASLYTVLYDESAGLAHR